SRRRWAIAGGVLVAWLVVDRLTGSLVTAAIVLLLIAGLAVASAAGLRAMGITRDHPWLRRIAARPWRDGQDVLNVAMRHLPEVFIVTPSGARIAPDLVELAMNPGDLASLREWMELDVAGASMTEVYEDRVIKHGARFAGSYRPEVYLVADHSIPQGRYRLRRGLPEGARYSPGPWDPPGVTVMDGMATVMDGMATVMEQIRPSVPVLRLVTGSSVAETSISGARAGRGPVELELPSVPTVSRVHATFRFAEGRWWVTSQGVNGLSVNGVRVTAEQALSDGDSIRWGMRPEAPTSTVEIG
ncbi:MAG: FHA domain-containing protein, partial [Trebonia sp.]